MRFEDLKLIDPLLRAVHGEGYTEPTPIQVQAIPHVLEGKDLLGCAQTGTGKTAAFALPILDKLADPRKHAGAKSARVLVLAPTRELAGQIAETQATTARAAYLPQVSVRAAFEADRQRFVTRAGANWFTVVTLRWNLFNGFADRARIEEANSAVNRAHALEKQATEGVKLEVRRAQADLEAAQQRMIVAESTIAQAQESLRITKNRYEAGLTTVTELLRSETALAEAQSRHVIAIHDQRLAGVALEFATGTLSQTSEVLK